jgi:hypothetical protein
MFYSLEHSYFDYCFVFRASARLGATLLKKVSWRYDVSEEGHIELPQMESGLGQGFRIFDRKMGFSVKHYIVIFGQLHPSLKFFKVMPIQYLLIAFSFFPPH